MCVVCVCALCCLAWPLCPMRHPLAVPTGWPAALPAAPACLPAAFLDLIRLGMVLTAIQQFNVNSGERGAAPMVWAPRLGPGLARPSTMRHIPGEFLSTFCLRLHLSACPPGTHPFC